MNDDIQTLLDGINTTLNSDVSYEDMITALKSLEARLKATEEKLQKAIEWFEDIENAWDPKLENMDIAMKHMAEEAIKQITEEA